jgi:hypothetical protein
LNGRQFFRVEPEEGEDRRCDLRGIDRVGVDVNWDAWATDNHRDVTVTGVHTTVLGNWTESARAQIDARPS